MHYDLSDIHAHVREHYGLSPLVITHFAEGKVNTSFKIVTQEGVYVFRVYEEKTATDILCELSILETLRTSHISAPRLVLTQTSSLASTFLGKPAILSVFLDGTPARNLTERQLHDLGVLTAQIHSVPTDTVTCEKKVTWEPESLARLFLEHRTVHKEWGVSGGEKIMDFFALHHTQFTFPSSLPKGITHQDIKKENVILRAEKVSGVIDFDNAYIGTFLHDLMTTILWEGYQGMELVPERVLAYIQGYTSVRSFSSHEAAALVDAFRYRLVREVFISPFAAVHDKAGAMASAYICMDRFHSFGIKEERVLLESVAH